MVSNIDIFQGIVSKLEIPVSWQHYSVVIFTVFLSNKCSHDVYEFFLTNLKYLNYISK